MGKSETIYINSVAEVPAAINAAVGRIAKDIEDMNFSDILTDQIPKIEEMHSRYFAMEADPSRTAWPPLASSTILKKGHSAILQETGRLQASLTSGGPGAVRSVSGRKLTFGTSVSYAGYHQSGYRNFLTKKQVPKRPMVGLSGEGLLEISSNVADAIVQRL